MSHVRGHVSGVRCHIFFFIYIYILDKVLGLVGRGSVINGGLPCQVLMITGHHRAEVKMWLKIGKKFLEKSGIKTD